jgi:hypothetical protein
MMIFSKRFFILIVTALSAILITSCATDTSISKEPNISAVNRNTHYVIRLGVGIKECTIGSDEACFKKEFGGSGNPKKSGDYWIAEDKGVSAKTERGKINSIFFEFYSRKYKQFDGITEAGIGANSKVDDVLRVYGKPEKTYESIVSEFGPMPGAKDKTLDYSSRGALFTFYDGRLGHIAVYPPAKP